MKYEYKLIRSTRKTLGVEVRAGGEIIVRAPNKMSLKYIENYVKSISPWLEGAVEKQMKKTVKEYSLEEIKSLREKAERLIPLKVEKYSKIMGLMPTGVKITSAKKRFGSCNGKNSLCFSLYLMDYKEEFVDAVVVHELAHIKEKNHGKNFYKLIEKYMPDYKLIISTCKNAAS